MSKVNLEIEVGVGIGPIKFGLKKDEIVSLLGEPDKTFVDYECLIFQFDDLRMQLQFEEDTPRLGWVVCHNLSAKVFGQKIFAKPKLEVLALFESQNHKVTETDDYSSFESTSFDDIQVELQFRYGVLESLNFGVLFNDDDERIWPVG